MSKILDFNQLMLPNDIKSYLEYNVSILTTSIKAPSRNGFQCYDDYYCNNFQLANIGHVTLGVFGIILTLTGLILNILLIPVMSLIGIRSSATYYMIAMAVSDSCLLIIDMILVVIRYLPSRDPTDQLMMYESFVAYFVPFGFPAKSVCQILTLSLCTGLVINRSIYVQRKIKSKAYVKSKISIKAIISILTFMIITKLPNFLLLKIVENYESYSTFISVKWTFLAKSWIFVFDSIIFFSVYSVLVGSVVFLFCISTLNHHLPHFKTFISKNRFDVPPEERIHRRERLYLSIGLITGLITIFMKLPHLLRYFFFSFNPISRNINQRYNLVIVDMWMEIMDMLLVVMKPILYLILAVHFRQALKDMIGLWVRPSHYSELKVSGGMGKIIDLSQNVQVTKINRSETSNTLLRCGNSDNRLNEMVAKNKLSKNMTMIDALAEKQVQVPKQSSNNINSISSESYLGSSTSFTSCYNSESQSSNTRS